MNSSSTIDASFICEWLLRNGPVFHVTNDCNGFLKALEVFKLHTRGDNTEIFLKTARCGLDDCRQHIEIRPMKGLSYYYHVHMLAATIAELFDHGNSSSSWVIWRNSVQKCVHIPFFVLSLVMMQQHEAAVRLFPSLTENIWLRAACNPLYGTTMDVPLVDQTVSAALFSCIPALHLINATAAPAASTMKASPSIASLLPSLDVASYPYWETLVAHLTARHLLSSAGDSTALSFCKRFDANVYATYVTNFLLIMSHVQAVNTPKIQQKLLATDIPDLSTCVRNVMDHYARQFNEKIALELQYACGSPLQGGVNRISYMRDENGSAFQYLYLLACDIQDKTFETTLKVLVEEAANGERVDGSALSRLFKSNYRVFVFNGTVAVFDIIAFISCPSQFSEAVNAPLIDGIYRRKEAVLQFHMRLRGMAGWYVGRKANLKMHIVLDDQVLCVLPNGYVDLHRCGASLLGMIVFGDSRGQRFAIYATMTRMFMSDSLAELRWTVSIVAYWFTGDETFALDIHDHLTKEAMPYYQRMIPDLFEVLLVDPADENRMFHAVDGALYTRLMAIFLTAVLVTLPSSISVDLDEYTETLRPHMQRVTGSKKKASEWCEALEQEGSGIDRVPSIYRAVTVALAGKHLTPAEALDILGAISIAPVLKAYTPAAMTDDYARAVFKSVSLPIHTDMVVAFGMLPREQRRCEAMMELFAIMDFSMMGLRRDYATIHFSTTKGNAFADGMNLQNMRFPVFEHAAEVVYDDVLLFMPHVDLKAVTPMIGNHVVVLDRPIKDCAKLVHDRDTNGTFHCQFYNEINTLFNKK